MQSVLLVIMVLGAPFCVSGDTGISPTISLPEFYELGGERFYIEEELASNPVMASRVSEQLSVRCRGCYFRSSIGPQAKMVTCGCCQRSFSVIMPRPDVCNSEQPRKEEKCKPYQCKVVYSNDHIQHAPVAPITETGRGIKRPHEHEPKTECSRPPKLQKIHACQKKSKSPVFHAIAQCALQKSESQQLDQLNGTLTFSGFESYELFLDCLILASNALSSGLITDREKRHQSLRRYADIYAEGRLTYSYQNLQNSFNIVLQINMVYLYKFQLQVQKCENNESKIEAHKGSSME